MNAAISLVIAEIIGRGSPAVCLACQAYCEMYSRYPADESDIDGSSDEESDDSPPENNESLNEDKERTQEDGSTLTAADIALDLVDKAQTCNDPSPVSMGIISTLDGHYGNYIAPLSDDMQVGGFPDAYQEDGAMETSGWLLDDSEYGGTILGNVQEVEDHEDEGTALRQRILADMRGETEMEFQPMEWEW